MLSSMVDGRLRLLLPSRLQRGVDVAFMGEREEDLTFFSLEIYRDISPGVPPRDG